MELELNLEMCQIKITGDDGCLKTKLGLEGRKANWNEPCHQNRKNSSVRQPTSLNQEGFFPQDSQYS